MVGKKKVKRKPASKDFPWDKLTWDDLSEWTDSRSLDRGRSYQRHGAVRNLATLSDGGLIADVTGTHRYATHISLVGSSRDLSKRLESRCSCPVGHRCKHAVAVILEYLNSIENRTLVPEADLGDARLTRIEQGWDEDAGDDFYGDDDDFLDRVPEPKRERTDRETTARKQTKSKRTITDADIAKHLTAKSKDELVDMVMQICRSDRKVKPSFIDRIMLETGDHSAVVREARKELRSVTAEEAWFNSWEGHGNLPDYSGLRSRLQALIDAEHFDAVVELGRELIKRGLRQVEQSHDEGETAGEIMRTLSIVAEAIVPSSMSDSEKILFVIDALLQDDYGLCDGFGDVLDQGFPRAAWTQVADTLKGRIPRKSSGKRDRFSDDFIRSYARKRLSSWIIYALEEAGEDEAATEFCIDEATNAGSYQRAVDRLVALKRYDEARDLAAEGLSNTDPSYAGLIKQLQDSLAKIASRNKDHSMAAAIAADRFVACPSITSLQDLLKAARKAKCESAVEQVAMKFLETGVKPRFAPTPTATKSRSRKTRRSEKNQSAEWPFAPPPEAPSNRFRVDRARSRKPSPHFDVLIRWAIKHRDLESALRWYDEMQASRSKDRFRLSRFEVEIADAVSSAYPDRAVELYCTEADRLAAETSTKVYPQAVSLLKKARKVLKSQKRPHEFEVILEEFYQRHHRKRRLVELLGGLSGQPIVSMQRDKGS
ncbi:MAG: SWIM zinc finger domain-containing protein [Planctomycetota bacterium]|nr:MAG: SWIM zinc finger domain-containing protein [Planctomycetota bacterium]REK44676.1 MAG: SWIM zinc finger domain-containing protein [Planctomycetota bacterium]